MKNVFNGVLKQKTKIMATHKTKLLSEMDRVILMKNVSIILDGPYEEVRNTQEYQ
jgi:ABC-type transport system involved in cytochrome bd biosynthesis fused ATPase/permease subunit